MLTEPLPSKGLFRVYSLQREDVFGEPLASNGLPLLPHYSGLQALYDNIQLVSRINVSTLCEGFFSVYLELGSSSSNQ
jgi:hypothetical protein